MAAENRLVLVVDLCASPARLPAWADLGHRVHSVSRSKIDACVSEPDLLPQVLRAELGENIDRALLVFACDRPHSARILDVEDWQPVLHDPLTRCFTALRGLGPGIAAQGGHIVAFLGADALLPDAAGESAAVLGRALIGLFEALRAELRQTTTRVTLLFTDPAESSIAFQARVEQTLTSRPFYSLPASIHREALERYFAPLQEALAQTPLGAPLSAGPLGEVYR
jgi:hypothetical protein